MQFSYVSLDPVPVTRPTAENAHELRTHQGIPSIERSAGGRLFAVWYTGGGSECMENYVMLVMSDDDGETWSDAVAVISPEHPQVRAFDPNIWMTPDGRLFIFWAQSCGGENGKNEIFDGIGGVFFSELENPDDAPENFRFSESRRIANGIMMDKPTVLSDGTWAFPCSVWTGNYRKHESLDVIQGAWLVASEDGGRTFSRRGYVDMHDVEGGCAFDEHIYVEQAGVLPKVSRWMADAPGAARNSRRQLTAWIPGSSSGGLSREICLWSKTILKATVQRRHGRCASL